MALEIFITGLLFFLVLGYLLSPLVRSSIFVSMDFNLKNSENLSLKKSEMLDTLKDLDLDHHMQKISDEDYRQMRQEVMSEGVLLMKKIEEKATVSISQKPKFCAQCGHLFGSADKFCSECGAKIG